MRVPAAAIFLLFMTISRSEMRIAWDSGFFQKSATNRFPQSFHRWKQTKLLLSLSIVFLQYINTIA